MIWRRIFMGIIMLSAVAAGPAVGATPPRFGGVGIDGVPQADGRIVVRQLVAGGPAHKAGMKVGDIITHVDGKPTRGSDFKQIVEYRLRGRAGTPVMLTVQRQGKPKLLSFKLIRRQLVVGETQKNPKGTR
jgi:C-terminal processing protease CtpA/Prc